MLAEKLSVRHHRPNTGIRAAAGTNHCLPVLAKLVHTEKIVPATVTFVDITRASSRALPEGEGLGSKFLLTFAKPTRSARSCAPFEDGDIDHVNGKVDPADDIDTINTELILADLQTIENAAKLEKDCPAREDRTGLHGAVKRANHSPKPAGNIDERLAKAVSTRIPSTICT